ncbi:MAG TPA: ThuA domain-containing protein [Opitutaceae bacterium]|nr:ThuA domain-containing protein [Opitutaceae bacterium]
MNFRAPFIVSLLLVAAAHGRAAEAAFSAKKVLFFSRSADFEHSVISYRNGRPSLAEKVLADLGEHHVITFTFSKDGSLFTPEYLAGFDAFVFYTTGDLTTDGGDRQPAMTPAGKAAFLQAISDGKGFVGIHSASDTFHSPGGEAGNAPSRFRNDGEGASAYVKMLGGEFVRHEAQQPAHLVVADPKFPGAGAVPADFRITEEWYAQKNFASDLHVILVQDTAGMTGAAYQRPPYPATWARLQGKGRVFYTNMGHRDDVWTNPVFQAVLLGGIEWALGRFDADLTPNMGKVAPQANVLAPSR